MNVILHGETETRMHLQDFDQVQHKISVPVKVFVKSKNKWAPPVYVEREEVYRFVHQIGDYCHYQLSHATNKQS